MGIHISIYFSSISFSVMEQKILYQNNEACSLNSFHLFQKWLLPPNSFQGKVAFITGEALALEKGMTLICPAWVHSV